MSVHPFRRVHDDALKNVVPACCGSCNQKGGDKCRTPDACQIPIEETPLGWWAKVKRWCKEFVADVETWR